MRFFLLIFKREWLRAYRYKINCLVPWIFFLLVITLFSVGLNPDNTAVLKIISPAVIWVGILLSILLSLDNIFKQEQEDNMLEQWILSPVSFSYFIFAKLTAYWMILMLPLLIFLPAAALFLHLSWKIFKVLVWTILLATPALVFIGAVFSAFTVSLRQNGLLLGLLVLPFYIPVLIFAASALSSAMTGLSFSGQLAFLSALLCLVLPLAPPTAAWVLKIGL